MNPVVVPVRNGLEYTKAALPTLLAQDVGDVRVILIDNDSSDGTGEWARSKSTLYWHFRPALSVAKSWNKALCFLFEYDSPGHALIVNNDVLLKPETYRLLLEDGGEFVTATGVNTMEQFNQPCEPQNRRPHPDFSCFLIRRSCWEKVGPFDECFGVAFFEDNSYHVRMHRAGVDAHCIGVPFFHHGSATVKNADEAERKRIIEAAGRNRETFFKMYGCYPATPEYEALFK